MGSDETVIVKDLSKVKTNEFKRESNLAEYISDNIHNFCIDILCDEYVSHENEFVLDKTIRFGSKSPRVDLKVKCKNHSYLVELKNPTWPAENRAAIGQMLAYSTFLDPMSECKMVIVTTMFDYITAKTIKNFCLPIKYVYFEKGKAMEYLGDA